MKNKKGFTLVELLAVIVILGILLLVAVPAVNQIMNKSKLKTARDSAMSVLESARACAMAETVLCTQSNIVNYAEVTGTIDLLTMGGTYDNPTISKFKYTENGYLVEIDISSGGCTISQAKNKIQTSGGTSKITSCS